MSRLGHLRPVLLVVAVMLASACAASVEVVGSSSTSVAPTTSSTTASEVALSDLVGNWDNGQLFLQILDDGSYQALATPTSDPNEPLFAGFVARDGVNFIFVTNIYAECPGDTGVYEVLKTDDQLLLMLVDDPCEFRAARFVEPWASVPG